MDYLFVECNESLRPYGVPKHRHLSEIEEQLTLAAGEKVTLHARSREHNAVRILVKPADVERVTQMLAGLPDVLAVEAGAKVNAVESFRGQNALMWAAGEGNAQAAAQLIEFGADVKAKSKGGFTPFLFAVLNNHIPAMKVLLEHGANIADTAPDGSTRSISKVSRDRRTFSCRSALR